MTCIRIGCAIVELLVAEKAAPASAAITLLDSHREWKSKTADVVIVRIMEGESFFFETLITHGRLQSPFLQPGYGWHWKGFRGSMLMTLLFYEWWRSINGLLCSVEFDDCTTRLESVVIVRKKCVVQMTWETLPCCSRRPSNRLDIDMFQAAYNSHSVGCNSSCKLLLNVNKKVWV